MNKRTVITRLLIALLCIAMLLSGCKGKGSGDESETTAATEGSTPQASDPTGSEPQATDPSTPAEPEQPLPPAEELGNALDKTFGSDSSSSFEDVLSCGKITLLFQDMIDNVLYIDSENGNIVDELTMNIEGTEINLSVFGNENQVAFYLPEILDNNAYGINLPTLADDLPNSPIWDMAGISYEEAMEQLGLSDMDFGEQLEMYAIFADIGLSLEEALEDALAVAEATSAEGTVNINGNDVQATIVTFKFTDDDVIEIGNIMVDWAEETLNEHSESLKTLFQDTEIADLLDTEIPFDDARNAIEEAFSEVDFTLEIASNINAETGYLMSVDGDLDVKYAGDDEEYIGEQVTAYLDLVLGEDPKNSNLYSLKMGATNPDGEEVSLQADFTRNLTDAKDEYGLEIKGANGEEQLVILSASLSYDKATDIYTLNAEAGDETLMITGKYLCNDDIFELSVDAVEDNGERTEVGLTLRVEEAQQSEIPVMPPFKNIFTMSQDEIMNLVQMAMENLQ
ncbi:MAG: hypothetical protein IJV82_03325 [Oscillospiraceae bacterium]|nr:hypothetical protein [Oscillospiraceae bacterium]